ncbi:hypothetical protein MARCHEWKA_04700 [Brevundimonas phage vB_BpoS-Marchewka]|uniref:DUF1643 domain-containing protein n=1 Tax=Brevundimonas phage vB_BpoS-Marchewka TaxID=2948604 RepID=A0A9E7N5L9_9CAUD|nr:hypothetical protein MARCHEWKA_04700 [Brevundimonas phage vB_BpoS-Marchewka]
MTAITSHAILSEENPPLYRYWLERVWDDALPVMVWVMLNPSTADHTVNDPTILACMDFARRNGCGSIAVVNLYGFRSPHPKVMKAAKDPIGDLTYDHLQKAMRMVKDRPGSLAICGWGNGDFNYMALGLRRHAQDAGVTLHCFGVTKDGSPKHPLARGLHRIPRDTPPQPYTIV